MNASRQLDDRYANVFVSYIRFVQQDVMWTVVYIIFLVWMYLFHAPFRFHSVWRTDWYAQVTKVLQIWIGVVVFFFHTGSWFFHPGQTTSNRYSGGEEDIFATIFFPIFSLTTLIILYIHKKKRDWGLGITYGANVVILLLNSLLISLFSTVHFGYCMQLQDIEHSTLLKSAVGILCPSSKQTLFPTLLLLSGINILFIVADYRYKKRHGYDPLRGILWGEHYELRKGNVHTIPAYGPTEDWRKLQPKPKRILGATRNRADMLTFRGKASFAATPEEVRSLSLIFPHNQPGMVPWFSTFIAGTALQSFLGASLNFLTFDQRVVEPHVFPKVFKLSFVSRLIKGGGCGDSLTLSESTVSTDNNKPLDRVTSDVWFDFIGEQRSSFFILQLPYNWFMLCADTGSTTDIDTTQRNYFFEFIEKNLNEASCVILVCHEPAWVYEAMNKKSTRPMQPQLNQVIEVLGTRLRLRLCGDVHHYSRHTPADALSEAPTLIVSGGKEVPFCMGRSTPVISQGTEYIRSAAFPAHNDVTSILARLVGFRLINWKFDIIAGVMCFGLIISALPLSMEDSRLHQINDVFQLFTYIGIRTVELFIFTINEAITSFILSICVFFIFFLAGGEKKSASFRGVYALHWTILVVLVSTSVLSFVQATLAYMTQNGLLLSTDGRWQSMIEVNVRNGVDDALNRTVEWLGEEHVISHGIRNVQLIAYDSFMVNGGCVLLRSMDVIENLAYLSRHVSTNVTGTFSPATDRLHVTLYYLHVLLFFWLLATPVVSFVIGVFLFVSVHFFDFLYDAAYSSFQIEDYKQFVRFKLDGESRSLHGYVVARTRVPKAWKRDSNHVMEFTREESKHLPPHLENGQAAGNHRICWIQSVHRRFWSTLSSTHIGLVPKLHATERHGEEQALFHRQCISE
uniref:Calcineurin-like phosphoesterase domain-containing protein n=1 Tax=Trypanosoma vivax (strain Y486) TaxID=1055687 RepID=G0TR24_TRYVY|nr:conserved hypothetical protein, fragment [Trypanosoma vivax Y486]